MEDQSRIIEDNSSDADSDLEELQSDIAKFDESVREFLTSHNGNVDRSTSGRRGGRGRGSRGPRKAAKPRGDITARLAKVNQAFLGGDYDRALDLVSEVIRINAETHQAWTALASIFREQGNEERALAAMVYAAHLRPKDVPGWLSCAAYALETTDADGQINLKTARLCYSAALKAEFDNLDARMGKAAICHQQGHFAQAITEYNLALRSRPADLDIVRKMAEACVDNQYQPTSVGYAIAAYGRFFAVAQAASAGYILEDLWYDIGVYVDLFAATSRHKEAIFELRRLSRWILRREVENFWDDLREDDREWDLENDRREEIPSFQTGIFPKALYGESMPPDLRARLATYRLKIGNQEEAFRHLTSIPIGSPTTVDLAYDFPVLTYELAEALLASKSYDIALGYFNILRSNATESDAVILLQLGRCFLGMNQSSRAEELFLEAIDADEDIIEARIELANMYEKAKENEEALILTAEAIALREARDYPEAGVDEVLTSRRQNAMGAYGQKNLPRRASAGVIPRRYRSKRFAGPDQRKQDEQARALKLSRQYDLVKSLKSRAKGGNRELVSQWMEASKNLVDDFRSLKRFYSWDKYLHFVSLSSAQGAANEQGANSALSQMYQRLSQNITPGAHDQENGGVVQTPELHQGISFDDWLEIFLDYAIGLAIEHKREDSYRICTAARDSTVFQSPEHSFQIYVAWGVCAVYSNDEETCVMTARQLMRDGTVSDSYRLFGLLSKICQSPVSWYTSGPAQKYILRQIKAIDSAYMSSSSSSGLNNPANIRDTAATMDVCLLMLYGHILFTSTSYTYAIGYFLRALAIDPENPMVQFSLGLAYIHYGLKRQATNRQYLLLQGQSFIGRYLEADGGNHTRPLAEKYYNVGRAFQLLGLANISNDFYAKAKHSNQGPDPDRTLEVMTSLNMALSYMISGSNERAFATIKESIIL